jgi:polyphosphate kinase 2
MTLWISNIDPEASDEDLRELVRSHADLDPVRVRRQADNGARPGAILEFDAPSDDALCAAQKSIDGLTWRDRQLSAYAVSVSGEQLVARRRADEVRAPGDRPVAKGRLKRRAYEKELARLHVELVRLQEWVRHKGLKVCVVFEGRDGAGKGGTIKAITERVSPRVFRVVALPAPTEREKTQMHMQRYLPHLPAGGEVVIFDRSWYNRAGVERVMGFCSEERVQEFLKGAPLVERAITRSGVIMLKYWLEVSPEEQTRRLESRIDDGRKIWKLSPMDLESYKRWYDYSRARDEMFLATDTDFAPWYVVHSDDKRRARLNIIRHLLAHVPYEDVQREPVKLPKRQKAHGYREPDYPYKFIDEVY